MDFWAKIFFSQASFCWCLKKWKNNFYKRNVVFIKKMWLLRLFRFSSIVRDVSNLAYNFYCTCTEKVHLSEDVNNMWLIFYFWKKYSFSIFCMILYCYNHILLSTFTKSYSKIKILGNKFILHPKWRGKHCVPIRKYLRETRQLFQSYYEWLYWCPIFHWEQWFCSFVKDFCLSVPSIIFYDDILNAVIFCLKQN